MTDTSVTPAAPAVPAGSLTATVLDRVWGPVERAAAQKLQDRTIKAADLATLTRAAFAANEAVCELAVSLAAEVACLEDRLRMTEERLGAVEQKGFNYRGVWHHGTYPEACFVTDRGGLWYSNRRTDRRPGDGDSGWVLAVKAGRIRSAVS